MARKSERQALPYTFARVSAMKSKLIDRADYHKLLKMDLISITRYLQESSYKEVITELSTKYDGIDLVDHSLRKSQVRTFDKLRKISPKSVVEIIDLYLGRWDFQNLKIVLRGIYSNAKREEVMDLIEAIGNHSKEHFGELFDTGSIHDAIKSSKIVTEKEMKDVYESFKSTNRLIDLENRLDHLSFEKEAEGSKMCPIYGETFRRFLLRDIDITNIKNLLRFKKEKLDPKTIMEYMIIEGSKLDKRMLEKLSKTDSTESLIEALKKTYYGKHIDFNAPAIEIELSLTNFNLKNAALKSHQNPMSISSVISFMISKMIEIKNIRSIVKSKHLGIDEEYIEKKLLIV